jgi:peptidoglycan/LPS O-acetylase OafA/YrhL
MHRITALDGVRGVAALVVLFYHSSLIARPHLDTTAEVWLTQSPSKVVIAGTEAVLVFFVLSGLVVALPALRDGFSWASYYGSRMLRLYLPVLGSLVLAALLVVLVPRDPAAVPQGSWLDSAQSTEFTWSGFFSEASLLRASYDLNNVLWSLRWELFFSLLLPVFLGLAVVLRRHALAAGVVAVAASAAGRLLDHDALVYYPVFLIGTLMAVRLDDLVAWARRPRHPVFWPAATVLAITLLIASWLARPITTGETASDLLWGVAAAGAALVIVITLGWSAAARFFDRGWAQWLGRTSFSLYLVHAPILGTLGYLVGARWWWVALVVGIPLSLAAGALFYRFVERPSHRGARAVGTFARRIVDGRRSAV